VRTIYAAALVAILVVALVAVPVLAGKGGRGGGGGGKPPKPGSGSGTLAMVMVDPTDTVTNYGDWVTFNIQTSEPEPWVNLKCWQNGTQVAEGWNGYFERSLTPRDFGLYSGLWTSGAADCTAFLTTPQYAILGSTSFHVEP
jgi:hypothetical protein